MTTNNDKTIVLIDRTNNVNTSLPTTKQSAREQINRILIEFGLDPQDYIFNPSEEVIFDRSDSAFQEELLSETPSITTTNRPLSYVEHLPPRPVIKRREPEMNQSYSFSHRSPPPPPSPPLVHSHGGETVLSADDYLRKVNTLENPPVKVVKPNTENIVYRKEIRIRYLQPPTPPPPAPIIIREKQLPPAPPESPLLIRERKPQATTPPPLTIRERPPTPPPMLEPYIVDKTIPAPPPLPRQIIIERLPTPPPKPRTVIFEKWLPYKKVKRPVLLQKAPPLPPPQPTRNVIIEYEPSRAYTVRRVIEEGVFRVDPQQFERYQSRNEGDVRIVDRIDDLPPPSDDLLRVLKSYSGNIPERYSSDAYSHLISNTDQLANVSRISSSPAQYQGQVRSPQGQPSSNVVSPTFISNNRAQSKVSTQSSSQ